jgi:hypothetical protein
MGLVDIFVKLPLSFKKRHLQAVLIEERLFGKTIQSIRK